MDGFYYIAAILVNANNPLTNAQPTTTGGKFAVTIIAAWGISVAVVLLSMISGPVFTPIGQWLRVHMSPMPFRQALWKLLVVTVIGTPAGLLLFAALLAGPMALVEGWDWVTGFRWLCSLMTALTNPLTNQSPATTAGSLMALLFDCWSLGLIGIALAIPGIALVPALCDTLHFAAYVRPKPKRRWCRMCRRRRRRRRPKARPDPPQGKGAAPAPVDPEGPEEPCATASSFCWPQEVPTPQPGPWPQADPLGNGGPAVGYAPPPAGALSRDGPYSTAVPGTGLRPGDVWRGAGFPQGAVTL